MYFAVTGNHPKITLKELQYLHPKEIKQIGPHLITFNTLEAEKLPTFASLIKRGEIKETTELSPLFQSSHLTRSRKSATILGTADTAMGLALKKKYGLKRFKKVDLLHTDREVKEKGIELITLPTLKGLIGIVQGYQNIKLYETVDFGKPARSMQTGMMPAKLTHTLINIGLAKIASPKPLLIRDPFCGTGTTGFLANSLGYNFIGSDIKLSFASKNAERWKTTPYFHNQLFIFIEQDISKPLNEENFNVLLTHQPLIITEGRLGPIIKQTTTPAEIKEYQRRVKNLYLQFLQTISDFFPNNQKPTLVFTIPYYIGQENIIEQQISLLTSKFGRKTESIDEIYKRENQKVGRQIIILQ